MRLTESILTQKVTTNDTLITSFTQDLKEKIKVTKDEFERTISGIDFNTTTEILGLDTSTQEVEDLDTIVDEKLKEVTEQNYKEKMKEYLKLQQQAASYIIDLKSKYKDLDKVNKNLVDQAKGNNATMLRAVQDVEQVTAIAEIKANAEHNNRLKMTKMIAVNPPPLYDSYRGFGSASGMLAFFNEELEDYFEDMLITDRADKCRIIMKGFGDKSVEYKNTVRRFFRQEAVVEMINNDDTKMKDIYKEIVCYVFLKKPKGEVGNRKEGESLTNFLQRWFTNLEYCGVSESNQGSKAIRKIFEKPEILQCPDEIIREFKKEFFVKHTNEEKISRGEVLGFAQRLDMIFGGESELGISAVSSVNAINYKYKPTTGLVALEKPKVNETTQVDRQLADLIKRTAEIEVAQQGFQNRGNNNNYNNQGGYNNANYNNNRNNYQNNRGRGGYRGNNRAQPNRNWSNNWNGNNYNNRNQGQYGGQNVQNNGCFTCGALDHRKAQCPQNGCWSCGNHGHIRANCPQENQGRGQYNNNQRNFQSYNNPQRTLNKPNISAFNVDMESMCIMNSNGDVREYVDTKLSDTITERAMLDTGATVDAISPELVSQLGLTGDVTTEHSRFIELADKSLVKIDGTIEKEVTVKGKPYTVKFTVMPGIKPKIIYGTPFLKATGILDDFKRSVQNKFSSPTQSKN